MRTSAVEARSLHPSCVMGRLDRPTHSVSDRSHRRKRFPEEPILALNPCRTISEWFGASSGPMTVVGLGGDALKEVIYARP